MEGKEILLNHLKEKSNEEEVIVLLQEQKKLLSDPKNSSALLSKDYINLIIKLAKNAKGKIKYHALIILSNFEVCMNAMNFYELCQVAAESSKNKDGNIRKASFILVKSINATMMMLPMINKMQKANSQETNLFYESFRGLFYRLYFRWHDSNNADIKKGALKLLEVMLPKFRDMATFWNDQEEIDMANKIKEELNKV